jgi:hypothetical protein
MYSAPLVAGPGCRQDNHGRDYAKPQPALLVPAGDFAPRGRLGITGAIGAIARQHCQSIAIVALCQNHYSTNSDNPDSVYCTPNAITPMQPGHAKYNFYANF